jgi:Family of unknown function (DUF6788)
MYAITMTNKKLVQIEKRIKKIKSEIMLIDDMRPGSLTMQYKDPKKKIGGYYQISYTLNMKSKTEYVRKGCVDEVRQQIVNYKRFKALTEEWVALGIEHSKLAMKLERDGD